MIVFLQMNIILCLLIFTYLPLFFILRISGFTRKIYNICVKDSWHTRCFDCKNKRERQLEAEKINAKCGDEINNLPLLTSDDDDHHEESVLSSGYAAANYEKDAANNTASDHNFDEILENDGTQNQQQQQQHTIFSSTALTTKNDHDIDEKIVANEHRTVIAVNVNRESIKNSRENVTALLSSLPRYKFYNNIEIEPVERLNGISIDKSVASIYEGYAYNIRDISSADNDEEVAIIWMISSALCHIECMSFKTYFDLLDQRYFFVIIILCCNDLLAVFDQPLIDLFGLMGASSFRRQSQNRGQNLLRFPKVFAMTLKKQFE